MQRCSSLILDKPHKKPFRWGGLWEIRAGRSPVAREVCLAELELELGLERWEGLRGWREEIENSRLEREGAARVKGQRQAELLTTVLGESRLAWVEQQRTINGKRWLWNAFSVQTQSQRPEIGVQKSGSTSQSPEIRV